MDEIERLIDEPTFWRGQGDGLALLAREDGLTARRLSSPVREHVYVENRFCVRPLLGEVRRQGHFSVLVLSENEVRLLECTRTDVREVDSHDLPESLRDVVGYDYEQRTLQFHTASPGRGATSGPGGAIVHGHGAGHDDRDAERERFLRSVDAAVRGLSSGDEPLILASVTEEAAQFRRLSRHPGLVDGFVAGSQAHRSMQEIHADALEVVRGSLDASERELAERVRAAGHSDRVVTTIDAVLEAAWEGRVAVLLADPSEPVWAGTGRSGRLEVHEQRGPDDDDVLDLAIAETVARGGEALPAERASIPDGGPVAAFLRY